LNGGFGPFAFRRKKQTMQWAGRATTGGAAEKKHQIQLTNLAM
jgi:hypothetical protein